MSCMSAHFFGDIGAQLYATASHNIFQTSNVCSSCERYCCITASVVVPRLNEQKEPIIISIDAKWKIVVSQPIDKFV